ncbi:AMNLS protein, partial [Acromyrmex heyeri]
MLVPSAVHRKIVLCVILISRCSALFIGQKYWLPDLEWRTASNWANNRIPEIDSHVIFPHQTRHAVGISGMDNLRLSGIDLPWQGLLVLPRDGKLQVRSSYRLFLEKIYRYSIAAPHLERVPCSYDNIVLPSENRTLSILLPVREVGVKSIRLSNERQPFTEWEWQNFQDRREFSRGRFTVKYSDLVWRPVSTLDCKKVFCQGNTQDDYLEEICAIQRSRCGFMGCEYPLTVEGHCCPYCGGRVCTWNGGVEILIKEKGDYSGITIEEAVENLREMLQNTGINVTNAETAGAAMKDTRLAVTLGPLFGIPLVVITLLLLAFLYFGYSLEQVLSGCMEAVSSVRDGIRADKQKHGFARFENIPEGNIQIGHIPGTSGREADDNVEGIKQIAVGRFENPLYRSKRDKAKERKILDIDAPLSLTALKRKIEDQLENEEMDTEE